MVRRKFGRQDNPWIGFGTRREQARLRLFCLPYAGGGAAPYRHWGSVLGEDIDLVPVALPGREQRLGEPAIDRLEDMLGQLSTALRPLLDRPFVLFGYSMGALIAWRLAHRLSQDGAGEPAHLFVGGRRAPGQPAARDPIHALPSAAFWQRIAAYGGTPAEVLAERELRDLFEPVLRADFKLAEQEPPLSADILSCPITAIGGADDPDPTPDRLDGWYQATRGRFDKAVFPGGHFAIHTANAAIAALVRDRLSGQTGSCIPI